MTTEKTGLIYQKIPAIMKEVVPISKDRKNQAQGYSFRGIDDVYNSLQPILAKHGVFMTSQILDERSEERTRAEGKSALFSRMLKIRYSLTAEDGSSVATEVIGEGMDQGDKAAAKAMSIAQKYALFQMFLIPTAEPKDPENDDHEVVAKPKADDLTDPKKSVFKKESAATPVSKFDQLPRFAEAKKKLGKEEYYAVLGAAGVTHADEIPVEQRKAVLDALLTAFKFKQEAKVDETAGVVV
jgi:hypothetical protein